MKNILVRFASAKDAERILQIYGWYIQNTAITFEYDIPNLYAFSERINNIQNKYPYIVAELDGKVVGYAYAAPYIMRKACDWSCEVSIYLDREVTARGIGRLLYERLEKELCRMGIVNMYASIACANADDPYVSNNSEMFHKHMGFVPVGTFQNCGYKFGRWYHLQWMEKTIGVYKSDMKGVLFGESAGECLSAGQEL